MIAARGSALAALLMTLLLSACEQQSGDPLRPPGAVPPVAERSTPKTPVLPQDKAFDAARNAPQIYMALQPDPSGPTSVIFAIDADRNDEPRDDPAIRLTPEEGKCNPQELRSYDFPAEVQRPVFGPDEAFAGVQARDLPAFMAMVVTSEMLRRKMIDDVEQSKPQNVCTRKLWERLIVNETALRG